MASMAAVGASATAKKSEAMEEYNEIFDGSVRVKQAENGGFVISADFRKEPKKKPKVADACCSYPYCPSKDYTAGSFDELVAQLRTLYGAK